MSSGAVTMVSGQELARAAAILRGGGLVAFPTETFYGLAADPFNEHALAKLFAVKQRSSLKPILVLIGDRSQLDLLAREIPAPYEPLMEHFWPGPLTLVFPAWDHLPAGLTCGTGTVGIRLSSHPLATSLVEVFGGPVTATSANISGQAAAISAREVKENFDSRVGMILDGGRTRGGKGSTLLGIREGRICCLREGAISFAELQEFLRKNIF